MSTSYSPIDEPSFTDTAFDAEEVLNGRRATHASPAAQTEPAAPQADFAPGRTDFAPETAAASAPAHTAPANEHTGTQHRRPRAGIARTLRLIRDSRTVMFLGLVFTILAGYILIVTISYFANIGSDQSAMLNDDFDPTMIRNAGGPFGAWIAHTLLYNWLGIGSFLLIYYLAVCGLSMLRVYRPPFWPLTLRCLLTATALSIICGLVTYEFASPIYWGGLHGHLLNGRLITLTGIWGALAVSVIMGGLVIILYLTEIKRIYGVASQGIRAYNERQAERRAERNRIREAEEAERAAREAAAEAQRQAAAAAEAERRAAELRQQEAQAAQAAMTAQKEETSPEFSAAATAPAAMTVSINDAPEAELDEIEVADYEEKDEEDNDIAGEAAAETTVSPLFAGSDEEEDFNKPLFSDSETGQADESDAADDQSPLFATADDNDTDETSQSESQSGFAAKESHPSHPTAEEVLAAEPYDPRAELSHFRFPTVDLLRPAEDKGPSVDIQEMEFNKRRLTETLRRFGVEISKIEATIGPTVTLYEIIPAEGVRTRSIRSLGDDLQLQLAAEGIRIIAPIPAKGTIGIEVPNKDPQVVSMRSVLDSDVYRNSKMELPMALGKTISNEIFMADLAKMPHLLVAGATGMGKSVGLNAIITSLLYKKHPAELKFVLIDPKRVELSLYRELERHYLASLPGEDAIITDMSKVVTVLNSLCIEMDNRLSLLEQAGARNIKEYNEKFKARKLNPEKHRFLPYIVLVIDEFADLIIRQGKEIENPVSRLAAVARAAGIHLIIATQRPTVNVITGGIKLNIPGRIAFRVIQGNDSRTILDQLGANQLIGRGDMLFSINGKLERVQCAFIDTPEVSAICESIGSQVGYQTPYELPEYSPESDGTGIGGATLGDRDPLFDECARLVVSTDTASTSSLQRRYSIGYNRAGKIMDQMEAAGIVGPSQGGKPRQVLVDPVTLEHILDNR